MICELHLSRSIFGVRLCSSCLIPNSFTPYYLTPSDNPGFEAWCLSTFPHGDQLEPETPPQYIIPSPFPNDFTTARLDSFHPIEPLL